MKRREKILRDVLLGMGMTLGGATAFLHLGALWYAARGMKIPFWDGVLRF